MTLHISHFRGDPVRRAANRFRMQRNFFKTKMGVLARVGGSTKSSTGSHARPSHPIRHPISHHRARTPRKYENNPQEPCNLERASPRLQPPCHRTCTIDRIYSITRPPHTLIAPRMPPQISQPASSSLPVAYFQHIHRANISEVVGPPLAHHPFSIPFPVLRWAPAALFSYAVQLRCACCAETT